ASVSHRSSILSLIHRHPNLLSNYDFFLHYTSFDTHRPDGGIYLSRFFAVIMLSCCNHCFSRSGKNQHNDNGTENGRCKIGDSIHRKGVNKRGLPCFKCIFPEKDNPCNKMPEIPDKTTGKNRNHCPGHRLSSPFMN